MFRLKKSSFFNNKNIIIDKLYKKLNNKMFILFKVKVVIIFFIN